MRQVGGGRDRHAHRLCEQVQVKVLADLDEPASEPRSEGGGYPFELSRVDGKRSWRLSAGSAEERAPRRAEDVFLDSN